MKVQGKEEYQKDGKMILKLDKLSTLVYRINKSRNIEYVHVSLHGHHSITFQSEEINN
jgi:hypothetical protein